MATYIIDPVFGNDDTGDGLTVGTAWQSLRNICTYYYLYNPSYAVELVAGDEVHIMNGTLSTINTPGDETDPPQVGGRPGLCFLSDINATEQDPIIIRNYPGHRPKLDANYLGECFYFLRCSHIKVHGLYTDRGESQGEGGNFKILNCTDIEIYDNEIYRASGPDNSNMSGINCTTSDRVNIHHNKFLDCYDRNPDTGSVSTFNSTSCVFFRGRDIVFHHNRIEQTATPDDLTNSGAGVKYKHSTPYADGFFHCYNNVFINCKFFSIETGSANSYVHHNLIIGGNNAISSIDPGGPTHQNNQIFEYNTIYKTKARSDNNLSAPALYYYPTDTYVDAEFPDDPKNIVFRKNIIYQKGAYTQDNGTQVFYPYMDDDIYNKAVPELFYDDNCYFNEDGTPLFFSFAGSGGNLGGNYTWAEWLALTWTNPETSDVIPLNYDANSDLADPQFIAVDENLPEFNIDSDMFRPDVGSPAEDKGVYSGQDIIRDLTLDKTFVYNVQSDFNINGEFEALIAEYTLQYSAGTGGFISGDTIQTVPEGQDGTEVTAVPNAGYLFIQWSDGVLTAARTDTNVTKDITVTAEFELQTRTLDYDTDGNGTITGNASQTVNYGEDGTEVVAVPNVGNRFLQWSDGVLTAARIDTNVTENIDVTATFEPETAQYEVTVESTTGGSTNPSGTTLVNAGNDLAITAIPDANYRFVNWTTTGNLVVDQPTEASSQVSNVNSNGTVTANFELITSYNVTIESSGNGTVSPSGTVEVDAGDNLQITATPNSNYRFVRWIQTINP